jgi:hypothetical protein
MAMLGLAVVIASLVLCTAEAESVSLKNQLRQAQARYIRNYASDVDDDFVDDFVSPPARHGSNRHVVHTHAKAKAKPRFVASRQKLVKAGAAAAQVPDEQAGSILKDLHTRETNIKHLETELSEVSTDKDMQNSPFVSYDADTVADEKAKPVVGTVAPRIVSGTQWTTDPQAIPMAVSKSTLAPSSCEGDIPLIIASSQQLHDGDASFKTKYEGLRHMLIDCKKQGKPELTKFIHQISGWLAQMDLEQSTGKMRFATSKENGATLKPANEETVEPAAVIKDGIKTEAADGDAPAAETPATPKEVAESEGKGETIFTDKPAVPTQNATDVVEPDAKTPIPSDARVRAELNMTDSKSDKKSKALAEAVLISQKSTSESIMKTIAQAEHTVREAKREVTKVYDNAVEQLHQLREQSWKQYVTDRRAEDAANEALEAQRKSHTKAATAAQKAADAIRRAKRAADMTQDQLNWKIKRAAANLRQRTAEREVAAAFKQAEDLKSQTLEEATSESETSSL